MKTREEWILSGKKCLAGAFEKVQSLEDPILPLRMRQRASGRGRETDTAEIAESVVRTFCLAAVLIREDPEAEIGGVNLREYYSRWILRLTAPAGEEEPYRAGFYGEDGREISQLTVESGLLVIALWLCEEQIWKAYSEEERGRIAAFLRSYAKGHTVMQNWRLFVMLIGAFLYRNGYGCDEERMHFLAEEVQIDSAGEGWYRDGQSFDYYTAWAYQIFLPVWNLWYGYEKEPELAAGFAGQLREMVGTYEGLFSESGRMILWGRSGLYRMACGAPFLGTFLLPGDPNISPARAREILEGLLAAFEGGFGQMPAPGLYDVFAPMVQGYSRTASAYWMSMGFWCLALPAEHPFWRAEAGEAESRAKGPATKVLDGPGLAMTRLEGGEVILRTGKVCKASWDTGGLYSYGKLAYHSELPWGCEVSAGEVTAEPMQYRILTKPHLSWKRKLIHKLRGRRSQSSKKVNALFWCGARGEALLRRAFFDWSAGQSWEWTESILLADVAVPRGILRADRLRCPERDLDLTLGAFSLAGEEAEVKKVCSEGELPAQAIVVKVRRPDGALWQLAMTAYGDWDELDVIRSERTTPENLPCLTPYVRRRVNARNRKNLLITQVISRCDGEAFAKEELFPLAEISEGVRPVLHFLDGRRVEIPYDEMSGRLEI